MKINDFPQNARWKVTCKETLGPISEWTGAAIMTRGQAGEDCRSRIEEALVVHRGPAKSMRKEVKGMYQPGLGSTIATCLILRCLGSRNPSFLLCTENWVIANIITSIALNDLDR